MANSDDATVHRPTEGQDSQESDHPRLPELLDTGWKLLEDVDSSMEPPSSPALQNKVKRAINSLEQATRMVTQLDLFSQNEELEEIATVDLKYLLLPALLGALALKGSDMSKREAHLKTAHAYFLDFLKRCKNYSIMQFELPQMKDGSSENGGSNDIKPPTSGQSSLVSMAAQRRAKIERYNQKKETETKLASLKVAVESGQADDEVVREFYLLHIRKWINSSLDEIESIGQELEILKYRGALKQATAKSPPKHPARPPMKPFILTRDVAQARVFGAGYPSIPTLTVDEWYEEHQKHGVLPDQGIAKKAEANEEIEKERQEKELESDDAESLQRAREMDEWKDFHRRGYGNRQNMG
ncbi:immunoglobulin-binding protein 1 [Protopterus annectens]|uniref:immunoglobulin-binding protein 1 n=1 Tax=Protopterus annectens TaxID=7888 RepID=UPI001CFA92A9|nr:immunoglobulin-binding protein 1 [Protopterus annectens]